MAFTWMNGRLVPESEAVVPFLTPGLNYGMRVFEGIAVTPPTRGRPCSGFLTT